MTSCVQCLLVFIAVVLMADARYRVYEDDPSFDTYFSKRREVIADYDPTSDSIAVSELPPQSLSTIETPKFSNTKRNRIEKVTADKHNVLLDGYNTVDEYNGQSNSGDSDTTNQRDRLPILGPFTQKLGWVTRYGRVSYPCTCVF